MSKEEGRDPDRWEAGCVTDAVRNGLILPDLMERLGRLNPGRIADVGCGTGYMSRAAAAQRPDRKCSWALLEKDPHMLQFASERTAGRGVFEVIPFNILKPGAACLGAFDFAFSLFSTLDFGMNAEIAANLVALLRRGGALLIYVPDMLEEVAQMCAKRSNLEPLDSYRREQTIVTKADRFTERIEPFVAHRIEFCIAHVLAAGALLQHLSFLDRGNDRRIVVMEFARDG